jgi:hypothetical protein
MTDPGIRHCLGLLEHHCYRVFVAFGWILIFSEDAVATYQSTIVLVRSFSVNSIASRLERLVTCLLQHLQVVCKHCFAIAISSSMT